MKHKIHFIQFILFIISVISLNNAHAQPSIKGKVTDGTDALISGTVSLKDTIVRQPSSPTEGTTQIQNAEPLYVIDGVIMEGEKGQQFMATFNSDEIESVNVLKDAAMTAKYGSRGANGVVIITTKNKKK